MPCSAPEGPPCLARLSQLASLSQDCSCAVPTVQTAGPDHPQQSIQVQALLAALPPLLPALPQEQAGWTRVSLLQGPPADG